MKYIIAALFSVITAVSLFAFSQETAPLPAPVLKPYVWIPIQGMSDKDSSSYVNAYDATTEGESGKPTIRILLMSFNQPEEVKTPEGTLKTLSIATIVGVDCKRGLIAPIVSAYFDIKTPVRETKPIALFKYTDNGAMSLSKTSLLYWGLCPIQT